MAVQSNDNDLKDLLVQVGKGELQLPEFQRSWVWDDSKIRKLIESITENCNSQNFNVHGFGMIQKYGNL